MRCLVLGDSLTVALMASKGRSSSRGMLSACRRLAALGLGGGCALTIRWVPSELNAADAPSRGRPFAAGAAGGVDAL